MRKLCSVRAFQDTCGRVVQGRHELVLVSPENLCYNRTSREMLLSSVYKENLVALVVDDNCIHSEYVIKLTFRKCPGMRGHCRVCA